MLCLEGKLSFLFWRLNCLVFKLSKSFIRRIQISRRFYKGNSREDLIPSKKVMCSKETSSVFFEGHRELLVQEAHGGALASRFGLNKTIDILKERFYWPKMGGGIHRVITGCFICHKAKSQFH